MAGRFETLTVDGTDMSAYVAGADKTRPGVLVCIHAPGVDPFIQDICVRLETAGFAAVAPDLYHRHDIDGRGPMERMALLRDDQIVRDFRATKRYLRECSNGTQLVVGFCMGGRVTFLTAISRPVGAAVTYYGGAIVTDGFTPGQPKLADRHGDLQCPWLGLFGDLDGMIPVEGVEQLRSDLDGNAQPTDIVRYADADHGFLCDERPSYNADAASDGWSRMAAWFGAHLS